MPQYVDSLIMCFVISNDSEEVKRGSDSSLCIVMISKGNPLSLMASDNVGNSDIHNTHFFAVRLQMPDFCNNICGGRRASRIRTTIQKGENDSL